MMNNQYENIPMINYKDSNQNNINRIKEYEKKVNTNTIKTIAVVISLIGTIMGIVFGVIYKVEPLYGKDYFNVALMLFTWIVADIIAVIVYTMAMILQQLAEMNGIMKIWNQTGVLSQSVVSTDRSVQNISAEWKCSNCGRINSNEIHICRCGQQHTN